MSIQLEANRKAWIERFCPRQDGRSVSWRGSESMMAPENETVFGG